VDRLIKSFEEKKQNELELLAITGAKSIDDIPQRIEQYKTEIKTLGGQLQECAPREREILRKFRQVFGVDKTDEISDDMRQSWTLLQTLENENPGSTHRLLEDISALTKTFYSSVVEYILDPNNAKKVAELIGSAMLFPDSIEEVTNLLTEDVTPDQALSILELLEIYGDEGIKALKDQKETVLELLKPKNAS
jgi:hypothetical protein